MRDESLNPELCEEEQEAERLEAMLLEARVVRALERVPEPVRADLAEDFAARVAARVPARRVVAVRRTQYGRRVAMVALAVMLVALVALTPRSAHESVLRMTMEWVLCAQVLVLGVGLGLKRWNLG